MHRRCAFVFVSESQRLFVQKLPPRHTHELTRWLILLINSMVAEVRSDLYQRLNTSGLIDFGNWQIDLKRAISTYLKKDPQTAANQGEAFHDDEQARSAGSIQKDR